ncbi:unnamed protein product [Chilo suppressalis]|uniref:Queuosine 5'-phosphate N-glycosylase/hydrolase n=1 Tax=Chilo suppressalis TaxID=168631 RepID=A0ABN8L6U1_CHISP|nr:unnamed protein product [Chilo suppressalis]
MDGEVLQPALSAAYIASKSQSVKIHESGIEKLSDDMLKSFTSDKLEIPTTGANIVYLSKEDVRAVDWIFVADALNFCFWSYSDTDKYTVERHSGYYALEAALSRALKEGHDITNPEYYSKITKEQLATIVRGDNDIAIPLFEERLSVLHEVGKILLDKYNGSFKTCLKEADKSALKLLRIIVESFPCFRDEAVYKGKPVSFYKRAQILVADIWNFYGGKDWGEFHDIDGITMFADYRVPQVLLYFGALSYDNNLMEQLKNDVLLPSGSEEEVEIRGCSIHCVELLKKKIKERIENRPNLEVPNSSLIDYYLWCYRRKYADEMEKVPFHKTLGIFY